MNYRPIQQLADELQNRIAAVQFSCSRAIAVCNSGNHTMGMVLSLVARKGGCSKTTSCLNLAGAALQDGAKRVLLIDLDSQASLSKACLGSDQVESLRPDCSVQSVAERRRSAGDLIRETHIPGLLILPAHTDLAIPSGAALDLSGVDADLVIIDTPPDTKNPAVRFALVASHAVASPMLPEALGLQSVSGVQSLLLSAGLMDNPALTFTGWMVAMRQRIALHELCETTLRRLHGDQVFSTVIPAAAAFKEAIAAGKPITHYSPKSAGAKVVRELWQELLNRLQAATERAAA
jgi:chromosome partitioning protein